MRVIAGSARRTQLKTMEGSNTRPTTDRIKETLFNMIAPNIYDVHFLDLFAGSGGIGIEALSRGAERAVFVENHPAAINCIQENLKKTHLEQKASVMKMDVIQALRRLDGREKFDYIFMDPPYNQELEKRVMLTLSETDLLTEDALIIVEASLETNMDYLDSYGFEIEKEKKYKTNKHYFIRKKEQ